VRGNKREAGRGSSRVSGLVAAMGAVMMLAAIGTLGCGGGGGNSGVAPFAGVWVANSGAPAALHFPGTDLNFGGTFPFPPIPRLNSALFVSPQDTLFDSNNNLWVVDGGANDGKGTGAAVFRFLFNQVISLNTNSAPAPNFIIKALLPVGGTTFVFPQFAAFDAACDLWVSDSGANVIFKFSTAQLSSASGVGLTPAAILTNTAPPAAQAFKGPLGIAFDGAGNLWVDNNGGTTIVEIAAAVLNAAAGTTQVLAQTVLNSDGGAIPSINNPWGILFDSSGNLWITNEQLTAPTGAPDGTVVKFTAASIAGGGIITPAPIPCGDDLCDRGRRHRQP
jgi:DNA-binding beta-propeller fold protein YncE